MLPARRRVTGATGGIGAAIVSILVVAGCDVIAWSGAPLVLTR